MIIETQLPNLLHRGKVRDSYDLGNGLLLMVATDRISAFDVVLPSGVPHKGLVLARMSAFWFRSTSSLADNHFIGMTDDRRVVEEYDGITLLAQLSPEIAQQSMIVRKAQRINIECIVRGVSGGLGMGRV